MDRGTAVVGGSLMTLKGKTRRTSTRLPARALPGLVSFWRIRQGGTERERCRIIVPQPHAAQGRLHTQTGNPNPRSGEAANDGNCPAPAWSVPQLVVVFLEGKRAARRNTECGTNSSLLLNGVVRIPPPAPFPKAIGACILKKRMNRSERKAWNGSGEEQRGSPQENGRCRQQVEVLSGGHTVEEISAGRRDFLPTSAALDRVGVCEHAEPKYPSSAKSDRSLGGVCLFALCLNTYPFLLVCSARPMGPAQAHEMNYWEAV